MAQFIKKICKKSQFGFYRLEIANFLRTFSHVGIFNPSFLICISPVAFSLVQLTPLPPLSCVNKYCILYTVCKGEGYGVLGLRQINTCRKVPLQINFLDDDILHFYEVSQGGNFPVFSSFLKISLGFCVLLSR